LLALSAYLAFAGSPVHFIMFTLVPALALTLGVLYERTHYKALLDQVPLGNWHDTGERFVDPETKRVVTVYADSGTGNRIYVDQPRS
jgi:hypothetical protein